MTLREALKGSIEIEEAKERVTWRPIETPPDHDRGTLSSIRVLGILSSGDHVFAQYTPFYLGRPEEDQCLWVCEGRGWATKPTHWMPLPTPPEAS
jgi:hypothetical protein